LFFVKKRKKKRSNGQTSEITPERACCEILRELALLGEFVSHRKRKNKEKMRKRKEKRFLKKKRKKEENFEL